MKNIGVAFLFVALTATITRAQDYYKDIQGVLDKIESSDGYKINSKIEIFGGHKNYNVVQSFNAEVIKNGDDFHSSIDDTEIFSEEDKIVLIDHEEQLIQIENQRRTTEKEKEFLKEIYNVKDSEQIKNVELISQENNVVEYVLELDSEVEAVSIKLDLNTNVLLSLEYFYNEEYYPSNNHVLITYLEFDFEENGEEFNVSSTGVLKKEGNVYKAIGSLSNYEVHNFLDN